MSALEECCLRCTGCDNQFCRELGEFCEHDGPLCIYKCCPSEHGEAAA